MGGMGFLKLISQAFPRPLPQSPLVFFPALSLALFFARAPLSERLEQARGAAAGGVIQVKAQTESFILSFDAFLF